MPGRRGCRGCSGGCGSCSWQALLPPGGFAVDDGHFMAVAECGLNGRCDLADPALTEPRVAVGPDAGLDLPGLPAVCGGGGVVAGEPDVEDLTPETRQLLVDSVEHATYPLFRIER